MALSAPFVSLVVTPLSEFVIRASDLIRISDFGDSDFGFFLPSSSRPNSVIGIPSPSRYIGANFDWEEAATCHDVTTFIRF